MDQEKHGSITAIPGTIAATHIESQVPMKVYIIFASIRPPHGTSKRYNQKPQYLLITTIIRINLSNLVAFWARLLCLVNFGEAFVVIKPEVNLELHFMMAGQPIKGLLPIGVP